MTDMTSARLPGEIVTDFVYPPIPDRNHDWQAYRHPYNEGSMVGWGKTKELAIKNLLEQEQSQ